MKTTLIMLDTPIIVSDEKIERDDWYSNSNDKFYINKCAVEEEITDHSSKEFFKKVIAGISKLPSIDFSVLSEEDCKKIGWIDIEKLSIRKATNQYASVWRDGFRTAQSLNEKKFSKDDLRAAIYLTRGSDVPADDIIQSLSQPKQFEVEVEMEFVKDPSDYTANPQKLLPSIVKPKITNNSIKILKVIG